MGGKKKTKWRKVPPEELSHITVKRSGEERTRSKEQYHSINNFGISDGEVKQQQRDSDFQDFPCHEFSGVNGENEEADDGYINNYDESDGRAGFYTDGFWVPVLEVQKTAANTTNITTFPIGILRPIPILIQHLPAYCGPTYPRFQTFEAPHSSLHATNFTPVNNDFYSLTKLQPKSPDEFSKENGATVCLETADNYAVLTTERPEDSPLVTSDVPPGTLTVPDPTSEIYDGAAPQHFHSAIYQDFGDHDNVRINPVDGSDDVLPPCQYPGYAFGHTVYNVPFYPVLSAPTLQSQSTTSWSVAHFQRRRRRKKKGYAEYAIIPQKKNTAPSEKTQKNPIANENTLLKKCLEQPIETKNLANNDFTIVKLHTEKLMSPQLTKNSFDIPSNSTRKENLNISFEERLLSYTRNVAEKIILNAKLDIIQNICLQDTEHCLSMNTKINDDVQNGDDASTIDIGYDFANHPEKKQTEKNIEKVMDKCSLSDEFHNVSNEVETLSLDNLKQNMSDIHETPCHVKGQDISNKTESNNLQEHGNDKQVRNNSTVGVLNESVEKSFGNISAHDLQSNSQNKIDNSLKIVHNDNYKFYSEVDNSLSYSPKTNVYIDADRNNFKSETDANSTDNSPKHSTDNESEQQLSHYSVPPQCSYMAHLVSSEALIRETELELNKLHQLTSKSSFQTNQSIYKLAYDENVTDQSETEDLDAPVQLKNKEELSCTQSNKMTQDVSRSEILVHEADSASDAGSEDVELLPHRYESESAQKYNNKHIYVNNLSLAVEMLRTRENLPYDDEFKRIVDDDCEQRVDPFRNKNSAQTVRIKPTMGTVNPGYVEDPCYAESRKTFFQNTRIQMQPMTMISLRSNDTDEGTSQNKWRNSIADSGVQSEDSGDEVGEEAKEADGNNEEHRCWNSKDEERVNFRRSLHARQQFNVFTPRTGIVNPCLCCIIM